MSITLEYRLGGNDRLWTKFYTEAKETAHEIRGARGALNIRLGGLAASPFTKSLDSWLRKAVDILGRIQSYAKKPSPDVMELIHGKTAGLDMRAALQEIRTLPGRTPTDKEQDEKEGWARWVDTWARVVDPLVTQLDTWDHEAIKALLADTGSGASSSDPFAEEKSQLDKLQDSQQDKGDVISLKTDCGTFAIDAKQVISASRDLLRMFAQHRREDAGVGRSLWLASLKRRNARAIAESQGAEVDAESIGTLEKQREEIASALDKTASSASSARSADPNDPSSGEQPPHDAKTVLTALLKEAGDRGRESVLEAQVDELARKVLQSLLPADNDVISYASSVNNDSDQRSISTESPSSGLSAE